MHLTSLTLVNFGPYYGAHTIALKDTVYAVQATHEEDPDRSNWIGKSWFLGAIRFLITGEKPESCPNEDGWISWGEKTGEVSGELSDGTKISRKRKLGSSTQLEVHIPGSETAKQDRAQEEIDRLIGMDGEDLAATSFIEQRQIARLVLADPADRTKIVNGWLELEPLQRAEDWLRTELNKLLSEDRALTPSVDLAPEVKRDELELLIKKVETELKAKREEREALTTKLSELGTWWHHYTRATRLPQIQATGKKLRSELDSMKAIPSIEPLMKKREEAALAKGAARDREYQLRELVADEWDGVCPKTCDTCPVQDHVRAVGASMQVELTEAESVLDDADRALEEAREALDKAQNAAKERDRKASELERLRSEGTDLLESVDYIDEHGKPPSQDEMREQMRALNARITELEGTLTAGRAGLKTLDANAKAAEKAQKRRNELAPLIRRHNEAIAVVGRQGAQREVAESALSEIERGANALLQSAGIDLVVEVSWAREGKGLATHCEVCGAAFPKTRAQKVCDICGAARGPKLVEKLIIRPNDRSGAADDIAGLAFQLSASQWLRQKRTAQWAVACIDEPFGQLDRANASALAARLHAMIRGSYAFEQGFLVAHDSSIMEALPARVQIHGNAQGSRLEVIG